MYPDFLVEAKYIIYYTPVLTTLSRLNLHLGTNP